MNTQKNTHVNSPSGSNSSNCVHYWRIHRRVSRRLWTELDQWLKDIIANDVEHTTSQFKWFEEKTALDTERLFQDGEYYYNLPETFKGAP